MVGIGYLNLILFLYVVGCSNYLAISIWRWNLFYFYNCVYYRLLRVWSLLFAWYQAFRCSWLFHCIC